MISVSDGGFALTEEINGLFGRGILAPGCCGKSTSKFPLLNTLETLSKS